MPAIKEFLSLKKNGELNSMMGQSEEKFVIPSPYFDVALSDDKLFIANTGYTGELKHGQPKVKNCRHSVNQEQLPELSADAVILHILRLFLRDL